MNGRQMAMSLKNLNRLVSGKNKIKENTTQQLGLSRKRGSDTVSK